MDSCTVSRCKQAEEDQKDFVRQEILTTQWPFANHRSCSLPHEELGVSDVQTPASAVPKPMFPIYIAMDNVRKFGGAWLDLNVCGACKKKGPVFFCALHQIVTCSDCQHHGACLHDFGACWTIDDSLAASQDVKVYLRHMRTIAIWQLIAPMREAQESVAPLFVEHIANFEFKAADLENVCRNKLSPDLACFTCKKQSVDFCSGCSLLLCQDHAIQHGRKTCNVLGLEDLVVGWQTQLSIRSSGRKAAHFVTDVAQLTPAFYVNVLSKKVVESMDVLTQFI